MYGLQRRGAKTTIASRTRSRAQFLADTFGGKCIEWQARHAPTEILVNCTPIGMHPNVDESPFNKSHLKPNMIVFDTVYNPESTLLLKEATLAWLQDRDGRRDVHPAGRASVLVVHRPGSVGGADAGNSQASDRSGKVLEAGAGTHGAGRCSRLASSGRSHGSIGRRANFLDRLSRHRQDFGGSRAGQLSWLTIGSTRMILLSR